MRPLVLALSMLLVGSGARAAPLPGKTYDYAYDAKDIKRPNLRWLGRAYVPTRAAAHKGKLPLVVFLHGLNRALIKYRWLGGGQEGDVRRIAGDLVEAGSVAPLVIAGPSSIVASEVSFGASWNQLDLDNFIDRTVKRLSGVVAIDEARVVVAGHSGAGCSLLGGLATAHKSRRKLLAVMSIDTCMTGSLAERLVRKTGSDTHLIVSYQTVTWGNRSIGLFKKLFASELAGHPASKGVLRELDHLAPTYAPHDATVKLAFDKWLPKILPHPASVRLP